MGYRPRRLLRNLLGGLAVSATVALIGIGLPALNNALPAARSVPTDRPYPIAAGVAVVPPSGAELDVTKTRPGTREGSALFVIGSVRYAVVVTRFAGTLDDAITRLRHKIESTRGYQVTGGESAIRTAQGIVGQQGTYASAGRDGRYAAFLAGGLDVEITAAGNDVELRRVLDRIEASILTLTFTGTS